MAGLLINTGGFSPTTGTLGSGVTFPTGHVVNTTKHEMEEYAVNITTGYADGYKDRFVRVGSEYYDVVLKKANSDILILGYFTMGNVADMIHFDIKFGVAGHAAVAASDKTNFIGLEDGLSTEHRPGSEDKMNIGFSFLHDAGTNAVGTTLTYLPYVGSTGTPTLQINNYSLGSANMEMVSHFIFLEVAA